MRGFYTLILSLLLSGFILAQDAVHVPLLEHFTNTRCGICGARNPAFFNLLSDYDSKVNHVSFHPMFPYSDCIFYQANTEGNMVRTNYYNINGTPSVYLNGMLGRASTLVDEEDLNDATKEFSFFEIEVEETINGSEITGVLRIRTKGIIPPNKTYNLFIMALEREVPYSAPNGENLHHNVFRRFVSATTGDAFAAAPNGDVVEIPFEYELSNALNMSEMYTMAFLQDETGNIETSGSVYTNDLFSSTSGVIKDKATISVYPNPAGDWVSLRGVQGDWRILNLVGQVIQKGTGSQTLPVDQLQDGIYLLQATNRNGERQTRKIVIR